MGIEGEEYPHAAFDEIADWVEDLRDIDPEDRMHKLLLLLEKIAENHPMRPWLIGELVKGRISTEDLLMLDALLKDTFGD